MPRTRSTRPRRGAHALALCGMALALARWAAPQEGPVAPLAAEEQALVTSLSEQGVHLDPRAGLVAIPATVEVIDDLLEYLLVGPAGARHETVFTTPVQPSVLNVALLALGAEPGRNARWTLKDPPPSEDELRAGALAYDVTPPAGESFHLYAGWRRGDEVYFYRAEDLVRDLARGQTMRRHRWVYLGSRLLPPDRDGQQLFAADVYQNLVNIAWFSDGNTLLTGALPECLEQTIWMSNAWLLPERGTPVLFVFARDRLESAPVALRERLPDAGPLRTPWDGPDPGAAAEGAGR